MEQLQRTYLALQKKLQHAEVEIIIFTNLPIDTLGLDGLAQTIKGKLEFFRNHLIAEIASHGSKHDFIEIERKLVELENEFYGTSLRFVHVHHHENVDHDDNISVCGLRDEEDRSDVSSVYEVPEMLYEVVGGNTDKLLICIMVGGKMVCGKMMWPRNWVRGINRLRKVNDAYKGQNSQVK